MSGEIDALIRLLEDESQTVITAVDGRLKALVPESLPALREARSAQSARIRSRARELLRELAVEATTDRLKQILLAPDPDLEEVALWFGRLEDPELDFEKVRRELDEIAAAAEEAVAECSTVRSKLAAFLEFMHGEAGFHGDTEDFYAFKNNFLHATLDRRKGMPISLILVYMAVGKRIGLRIDAVGAPARALAYFRDKTYETYIDAFGGGRLWSYHDCVAYLKQGGIEAHDTLHYLRRLNVREIAERITRNLISYCNNSGRTLEGEALRRLGQALVTNRGRTS